MTNLFLKVNKDLFKLKLNPTEILLLAQVMEYQTNTGDFFMSDDVLADNFGVSSKTISRSLKALEDKGYICRTTKNTKGGKERHITVNLVKIEEQLAKDKMTVDSSTEDETKDSQQTKCPLPTDKMSLDKGQNDFIKDKGIDKEKDNFMDEMQKPEEEVKPKVEAELGSMENPIEADFEWLKERAMFVSKLANGLFAYGKKYYVIKEAN